MEQNVEAYRHFQGSVNDNVWGDPSCAGLLGESALQVERGGGKPRHDRLAVCVVYSQPPVALSDRQERPWAVGSFQLAKSLRRQLRAKGTGSQEIDRQMQSRPRNGPRRRALGRAKVA